MERSLWSSPSVVLWRWVDGSSLWLAHPGPGHSEPIKLCSVDIERGEMFCYYKFMFLRIVPALDNAEKRDLSVRIPFPACPKPPGAAGDRQEPTIESPQPNGPPYADRTRATYTCSGNSVRVPSDGAIMCQASRKEWSPPTVICIGELACDVEPLIKLSDLLEFQPEVQLVCFKSTFSVGFADTLRQSFPYVAPINFGKN